MTHAQRQGAYRQRQAAARAAEQARLAELEAQDVLVDAMVLALAAAANRGSVPALQVTALVFRADAEAARTRGIRGPACLRALATWFR